MIDAQAELFWTALDGLPRPTLKDLFADPERLARYSATVDLPGGPIIFDWSKTHLSPEVEALLGSIAAAMDLEGRRDALINGEKINNTEGRAAEHTAQRGIGKDTSVEEAAALHARMQMLVDAIHEGALGEVNSLIHIGIGGSALGPALAIDALTREGAKVAVHVVSNIDGCALEAAMKACDPATTMIAIASKTFTTTETMTNAHSALDWLRDGGVSDPFGRVVALTAAPEKAVEWGVDETRVLPFSETVGGRYSLWSSIGFPVAIALGWQGFAEFLDGAAAIDRHFIDVDLAENVIVRAAFADLYYAQVRACQTRAVFAYDERLALLPDYLQQLEMESNGKRVLADGSPLTRASAPVTWGGVGTDAQHAVFQLLHQGTHLIPVDFLAVKVPGHDLDPVHHQILLSNCFAQGAALMAGSASDDGARDYPGDRPSATILCDDLNPATLGALIAFHEHRTFVSAAMLGINPFDQFGVELGKAIAKQIDSGEGEGFDPSTEALLAAAGIGE
ncbi:MAG: glucose-6-phosphate isomerase [Novosphingobium sp. 16-62-11]|uniref:glucose-6-phosphate isomerase n=1 Tax=Novosphingobium sp. 17-62-19 TaxID=1970406 RepID=UPI000BDD9064|nr:glucose-6-phosphate isomerase [Novosphingobium sp. 17-62-19]OYZ39722.1 MAG: glucose-6-phosphate isomerase [Novosphingobium sp. 16-62-11]OZA19645.1 MAG: glucose-6-phosphate isomerase [Novosphingobium sp. 17-62-19]HQS97917.1 glucose-6-phosphate isomerase [Novosphingobium sp.]